MNDRPLWTPQRVKLELPNVLVIHNGRKQTGTLSGRLNKFATVSIGYSTVLPRGWIDYSFAWQTIATALNHKRPLRAE